MKLGGTEPTPAPAATPAPSPDAGQPSDTSAPSQEPTGPSDKPFNDEPFDAGVEADENSDPKKYIEQLTGKLGQSLRKYNEKQGQPDFELEKFAVNSLLAATHTAEMDSNDQEDIIKKVKTAGNHDDSKNDSEGSSDDSNTDNSNDNGNPDDLAGDLGGGDKNAPEGVEENLFEKKDEGFLIKPKKMSIFAPEGSEEAKFNHIKTKLQETFNQEDMTEPTTVPVTKPAPTKEPSIKPSRKNKPFLPTPSVQPDPKAMDEEDVKKKGYEIYHSTLSSAVQTAEQYAEAKGFKVNPDDWFNQISTGPRKPEEGKTNRYSIPLIFKDKPSKKNLNIQVYNRGGNGNKYELNCYVA